MEKTTVRPLAMSLTVLGILGRLMPHPWNFTPVGSVSLFSGARMRGWQAFLLPLFLMAVTDPLVGGYSVATPFVYAAFLVNVWIGRRLRASENAGRIGAACLVCSTQFFLITNFGMWLSTAMYPHTAAGLAACYVAALPFFGYTLAGDLAFAGLFFGLHAWLSRKVYTPERIAVPQAA